MLPEKHSKKRQKLVPAAEEPPSEDDQRHSAVPPPPAPTTGTGTPSDLRLGDLPNEAFHQVLSFLDFTNRQALTTTYKIGLREVEKYSQILCERIQKEHSVDETFEARVGEQARRSITTTQRQQEEDTKPFALPWRVRAKKSLETYLYKIDLSREYNLQIQNPDIRLSPSEHHLAVAELRHAKVLDYIDLSTRRASNPLFLMDNGSPIIVDNNTVVSYHASSWRVWKEDVETGGCPQPIRCSNNSLWRGNSICFQCHECDFTAPYVLHFELHRDVNQNEVFSGR